MGKWRICFLIIFLLIIGQRFFVGFSQNVGQILLMHGVVEKQTIGRSNKLPQSELILRFTTSLSNAQSSTWCSLGLSLFLQGKEKEAIVAWRHTDEKVCDLDGWGNLAFDNHELDEAYMWYRLYHETYPNSAKSLYYLGLITEKQGDLRQALSYYEKAQNMLDQDLILSSLNFHIAILQSSLSLRSNDDIVVLLEAAIQSDLYLQSWERTDTYYHYGEILKQEGRIEDAVQLFEQVLKDQPNHYRAYIRLGEIAWLEYDDVALAEKYFLETIRINSENTWGYNRLATMYVDLGEVHNASQIYTQLLKIDSDNQAALRFVNLHQEDVISP
jgi:tetratricopeptide (TPR) repeat protein